MNSGFFTDYGEPAAWAELDQFYKQHGGDEHEPQDDRSNNHVDYIDPSVHWPRITAG